MLEENTGQTQTRVRLSAGRKSTFRPDIAVSAISAFSLKARTPRYRSRFIARNWTRMPIGSRPTPVSTNQPLRFYREREREREPLRWNAVYRGKSMDFTRFWANSLVRAKLRLGFKMANLETLSSYYNSEYRYQLY